jgi:hypothetical protein
VSGAAGPQCRLAPPEPRPPAAALGVRRLANAAAPAPRCRGLPPVICRPCCQDVPPLAAFAFHSKPRTQFRLPSVPLCLFLPHNAALQEGKVDAAYQPSTCMHPCTLPPRPTRSPPAARTPGRHPDKSTIIAGLFDSDSFRWSPIDSLDSLFCSGHSIGATGQIYVVDGSAAQLGRAPLAARLLLRVQRSGQVGALATARLPAASCMRRACGLLEGYVCARLGPNTSTGSCAGSSARRRTPPGAAPCWACGRLQDWESQSQPERWVLCGLCRRVVMRRRRGTWTG